MTGIIESLQDWEIDKLEPISQLPTELSIEQVTLHPQVQLRVGGLDVRVVEEYSSNIEHILNVRPIEVIQLPDGTYLLAEGHHRRSAAIKVGLTTIKSLVYQGLTWEDAADLAVRRNRAHGVRLTENDRDVMIYNVKSRHRDWSLAKLALFCSVSTRTVSRVFNRERLGQRLAEKGYNLAEFSNLSLRHWDYLSEIEEIRDDWMQFAKIIVDKKLTAVETKQVARNLKDDSFSAEDKIAIVTGKMEPVVVQNDGTRGLLQQTVTRLGKLVQVPGSDISDALDRVLVAIKNLWMKVDHSSESLDDLIHPVNDSLVEQVLNREVGLSRDIDRLQELLSAFESRGGLRLIRKESN